MELKVLGCHGGETPKHRTSSFLVNDRLAIDAGALTNTLTLDEQQKIEAVVVSHAHMDHVRDLATIADNRCQQDGPPLIIAGTPATIGALRKHFFNDLLWPDFANIDTSQGPTIRWQMIHPEEPTVLAGLEIKPVLVSHTIETAGFVVSDGTSSIAYSGDTGPTDRFWEVLREREDLRAILMEVSFPSDQTDLAHVSGHHTPKTLAKELSKLPAEDIPVLLFHIKPVFQGPVERELAKIKRRNLNVLQLEDQFLF
ncbi:MAG: 3',5'-cyclic-nucleotide phosphodiesterase [Deltaproteobacteria bacterium]|nr:3',5'-cyclic-nucleotide phosphodiesterase [Deltaproteobacteria bacterium]